MKDTHPAIEELFFKMLMERSGEERLKMGFEMDETARRLATASLFTQNREVSEKDIKIAIFERFYGNDLSADVKQKFISRITGVKIWQEYTRVTEERKKEIKKALDNLKWQAFDEIK